MLSLAELQQLADKITYYPGWEIVVRDGKHEGNHLVIRAELMDSTDLTKTVPLDIHSKLPRMRDAEQFYDFVLWRLQRIANHETREFYKVDGVVYDDPHAEFADRDE